MNEATGKATGSAVPISVDRRVLAGDSLVVPKGYRGGWEMPVPYRELIVVDTEFMPDEPGDSGS